MKESPLVTVLMPCYNAMPFLPEALESIINQTYKNLEILCINDGSTDITGEVLNDYAKQDSRIRVVHNETNLKLIATLNKGINLATGRYIARMDADDISFPTRIEHCVQILEANSNIDLISPRIEFIDEAGHFLYNNPVRNLSTKGSFFASFFFHSIGHPEIICKTSMLKENNYSSEETALHTEDYELWTRLLHKKHQFIVLDKILFSFRINSNSVSHTHTKLQDENFVIQANKFYNSYTKKNIPLKLSKIIVNRIEKGTSYNEIRKSLIEIKEFKSFFIQKEMIKNRSDLNEIKIVYTTHTFDILFQVFKKCVPVVKFLVLPKLVYFTIKSLLDKKSRYYILSKFTIIRKLLPKNSSQKIS